MNTPDVFLDLLSKVDIGYACTQADGTIIQVNQAATRLFKRSLRALVHTSIYSLIASQAQQVQQSLSKLNKASSSEAWELMLRRAGDAPLRAQVQVVAGYDPDKKARYFHWLLRDLTEQYTLQRIKEQSEFLGTATDELSVDYDLPATVERIVRLTVPAFADLCIIHVRDGDGKLIQSGVAHRDPGKESVLMEAEYEHRVHSEIGIHPPKLLPTHKRNFRQVVTDEVLRDLAYTNEHLILLRRMRLDSFLSVPLKAYGQTFGAIAFGLSDSDRTYQRDDLDHAEKFARHAAVAIQNALRFEHAQKAIMQREQALTLGLQEIRLSVNVIQSALHLLEPFTKEPAPARRANGESNSTPGLNRLSAQLDQIARSADRILSIVTETNELIRLQKSQQPPNLAWTNLSHLVAQVTDSVRLLQKDGRYSKSIRLELDLPTNWQVYVRGDGSQLRLVLANLLDNALKFTPKGAVKVELSTEPDPQDAQRLQAHLIFRDQGIGIPPDEQERIFDAFVRASNTQGRNIGGIGMGLALSRELVVQHDGRLWVESQGVDQGSAFHVILPRAALEAD